MNNQHLNFIVRLGNLTLLGPSIGRDLSVYCNLNSNMPGLQLDQSYEIALDQEVDAVAQIFIREKDTRPEYDDIGQQTVPFQIIGEPGIQIIPVIVKVITRGGDRVPETEFEQELIVKVWFADEEEPVVRVPGSPGNPPEQPTDKPKDKPKGPPLVFVPGIMSCELKDSDGNLMWISWRVDGKKGREKTNDAAFAKLEEHLRRGKKLIPTEKFVHVYGKDHVTYKNLIDQLRDIGYSKKNENLLIFYYDWTLSIEINARKLAKAVEEFMKDFEPEYTHAKCICHSMGGLIARAAMKFDRAKIDPDQTVYIATPHLGSPAAYFSIHPKIDRVAFGSFKKFLFGVVGIAEIIASLGESRYISVSKAFARLSYYCQSSFELLPDHKYLKVEPLLLYDSEVVRGGWKEVYFYKDSRLSYKYKRKVAKAMSFKERLGEIPGKPLLIFATKSDTPFVVNFYVPDEDDDGDLGKERDFLLPKKKANGDETVPRYSGEGGEWNSGTKLIIQGEHIDLPDQDNVIAATFAFLKL